MKKIIIASIVLAIGFVAFLFGENIVSAKDMTVYPKEERKPSGKKTLNPIKQKGKG